MNRDAIVGKLQAALPNLLAVHAFGSRVQGTAQPESDLDLAILVAGYTDPVALFGLAGDLVEVAKYPVDLLDLRAASTVMQYQIITTGERWWAKDAHAGLFEAAILSEKTALDTAQVDIFPTDKAATIERCVARAREVYALNPAGFASDYTRQDAAILNIQRACDAALDMGQHLIRRERLGVPQSARDVFSLLAQGGWITADLADGLKRMVGFRNIAVHDYQTLQLPITVSIIEKHLDEFLLYSQSLLRRDAASRTA
ncbi:type VII toxin-antitoxin system HepT family RNase toxin [Propionivibrio limicola]|uniref:type VII toxin-antitoxin system HepT family RNase toxin n=1 Tax=Propionivibrio limicola TaxID=167645 RepID=UPI001B86B771|nr:HepT-like ribonuclease domain-containing protein [Propionivibrio limicola]